MNKRAHIRNRNSGIQMTIMVAFSIVAVLLALIISLVLYNRFRAEARQSTIRHTEQTADETRATLEDYLGSMRQISDAVNFNVISELDASDPGMMQEMGLIYESYKDRLNTIALYNGRGSLVAAVPVATQKSNINVSQQSWFTAAMDEIENMHFSVPHVQNLFDDSGYSYHWVISLSRAVDVTDSDVPEMGVLLVDMNVDPLSEIMEQINSDENSRYYYLCDGDGRLIYHPRKVLIRDGEVSENSAYAATLSDGLFEDTLDGAHRDLVVRTIRYTGWKLVGVIPSNAYTYGIVNIRYFIVVVLILTVMMMLAVNRIVSGRISRPILKLDASVKAYEAGAKPEIAISGSTEIRHLGHSIQNSYERIDTLMDEIVQEQNERRKSELDALQSQINPHFLYNTLDSITWMVEGGRNKDAVYMISELARLLRISLSNGHSIIRAGDEIRHAQSYMNIQKIRYKERFSVSYDIDPEILEVCTVKLILQPILENAIYYGVGDMDEDEGGAIVLSGHPAEDGTAVEFTVSDNGLGMPKEEAAGVLTNPNIAHKHGSGVGLANVNRRIRLTFGEKYGLFLESEPDVGTTVTIRIPRIPFTEENRAKLEEGKVWDDEK